MCTCICAASSDEGEACFVIFLIGQGSFSTEIPLGVSGPFILLLFFQIEHKIMHPFQMLGGLGVFEGSFFIQCLVSSSLIRETTENELANYGYKDSPED
jgi:photosystem II P680 reaction center D1 protein